MKNIISKELLSDVLGVNVVIEIEEDDIRDNILCYWNFDGYSNRCENINIHELAHKCKEWALINFDISIYSYCHTNNDGAELIPKRKCTIIDKSLKFKTDTEPKAIFAACQWILDNKDKQ